MVAGLMTMPLPALLSVVIVLRNEEARLDQLIRELAANLALLATDYELVVIDNGSTDSSVERLQELTKAGGVANLQIFCLAKEVDFDTAAWAGIENALGDYVAAFDPLRESAIFLPQMIAAATSGSDVVFAENEFHPRTGWLYGVCSSIFHATYRWFQRVDLKRDAPGFRLLSRRIINFVTQHPVPALSYRLLPAIAGFRKTNLRYRSAPLRITRRGLLSDVDRALRLLVSSTRLPIRLVTTLSMFGAVANVLYSLYVIAILLIKKDVAPGWVTLSLQQSGMFFLISLVLLVLGEYILQMAALSTEGPRYFVAQEFTSAVQTRRGKLNIEETQVLILPARDKAAGSAA